MQSRRETKMVVWLASIRLRSYGIIDCACPVLCDVWGVTKSYFIYITPKLRTRCLMHIIITLDFLRLALSSYKIREHSRGLSRFLALVPRRGIVLLLIRSLSKHKFKAAIHRQLLDILLFEDDSADTLTITSRFKQLWSLRYFSFRLI